QVKTIYFDCPSGASGDMILGALLDAGVSLDALRAELAKLGLPGWALTAHEVRRGGFRATKADVELDPRAPAGPHRSLGGILGLLDGSGLPARVRSDAARILSRLAEAEARADRAGGRLRRGGAGARDPEPAPLLRRGHRPSDRCPGDGRAGRDDDRRHVAQTLRAVDGPALRGRRPRRLPHAGRDEAEPARRDADRALSVRPAARGRADA